MPEAMLFNQKQGVVLDDIVRFWKADKPVGKTMHPCIFFVDVRGDSFHVVYESTGTGRESRDCQFSVLLERI